MVPQALSALAHVDARRDNTGEVIAISAVGLILGGIFVYLGSKQSPSTQPPAPNVNCPNGCSDGQVCDAKTRTCVFQGDGPGGLGCPSCGFITCCPPWVCDHSMPPPLCYDPTTGQGGSGQSQCPLPCAQNGMVCNPHTHQCEHSNGGPWTVDWGPQLSTAIVFLENVTPIVQTTDPSTGGDLPFPIDADISFTYVGPGGSATVGFSLESENRGLFTGLCSYGFNSHQNVYLDPASSPTDVVISTVGVLWPDNCFLCAIGMTFTAFPYVVLPDGVHYGPPFASLLSC